MGLEEYFPFGARVCFRVLYVKLQGCIQLKKLRKTSRITTLEVFGMSGCVGAGGFTLR